MGETGVQTREARTCREIAGDNVFIPTLYGGQFITRGGDIMLNITIKSQQNLIISKYLSFFFIRTMILNEKLKFHPNNKNQNSENIDGSYFGLIFGQ